MILDDTIVDGAATRRRFLRLCGGGSALVGSISVLSACKDDVVGAEAVANPTPTPTATSSQAPSYSASDADRLNFVLQLHYLLAAYVLGAQGTTLSADLTGGTGNSGTVTGGRQATFTDAALAPIVREVTDATIARIRFLRRLLGSAAASQPAINIAGGQGGPFQAVAAFATTTPVVPFDPYASDKDFLLGAIVLSAVACGATIDIAANLGQDLRERGGRLAAGVAATNSIVRNAAFAQANAEPRTPPTGQPTLFDRAGAMSDVRDSFDGPRDLDRGLGFFDGATWVGSDINAADNGLALRRTPEQALGILYASSDAVSSGAFFPSGVNGTIRSSGSNRI